MQVQVTSNFCRFLRFQDIIFTRVHTLIMFYKLFPRDVFACVLRR